MPRIQAVLFDFDGTLANSAPVIISIGNRIAQKYGIRGQLTHELFKECQEMQPRQALKHLGIKWYQFPFFVKGIKKELRTDISQVEPFEGMEQICQDIKSQRIPLGILTSNTYEIVTKFLEKHNWKGYFQLLEQSRKIHGKSKVLKKILAEQSWEADSTIYIGDEARDIVAAHKTGMPSIAVTWGLNSQKLLSKQNPTYLVDTPTELRQLIEQLTSVEA